MRGPARWAAVAAIVGIGGLALAAAVDYEIRLSRPDKVGAEFRMEVTGRNVLKIRTKAGLTLVEDVDKDLSVDFEAALKVLEVDKNGDASKVSMTVEKCIVKEGGVTKKPIPRGTVVVGRIEDNEDVFEIDGEPVDSLAAEALELVISLGKGDTTDDEILGTKERRKVGDSWAVNAAAMADQLSKYGMKTTKEDVKGTVAVAKALKVEGADCLQIAGEVDISRFTVPVPPGLRVEKASGKFLFSGKFPVDVAKGVLESSDQMTTTVIANSKPETDESIIVEMNADRSSTTKFTYTK